MNGLLMVQMSCLQTTWRLYFFVKFMRSVLLRQIMFWLVMFIHWVEQGKYLNYLDSSFIKTSTVSATWHSSQSSHYGIIPDNARLNMPSIVQVVAVLRGIVSDESWMGRTKRLPRGEAKRLCIANRAREARDFIKGKGGWAMYDYQHVIMCLPCSPPLFSVHLLHLLWCLHLFMQSLCSTSSTSLWPLYYVWNKHLSEMF